MKSILVIGMGRFGVYLSSKLLELDNDVMIVDRDETKINELAPLFTNAQIGDCTNENVIKSLGVENFDICFVTIGENFQSSLEITSLLKEYGAKRVISKANRQIQAKFLLRNGADEVVYPEKDSAEKLAIKCNADNVFDYIQITKEYSIFEIPSPDDWKGKSIMELNVRNKYKFNILAITQGDQVSPLPGAAYVFKSGDRMIVFGKPNDVFKFTSKY